MQYVIETKRLCKTYGGRTVVHNLDLHVPQGCVYGFIGPNGAGKSTSMKMLLGLVHPTAGSVALLGRTLTERTRLELLRQTGSLIESPSGYLHLTAQENLEIVADLKGVPYKDIDRVLEIVHLQADRKRKVGQYSLGMKQRLGIAMALLGHPALLVLDEPINGLDADGMRIMREVLVDITKSYQCTVVISSHILGELEKIATHYGIVRGGKMIKEMTAAELDAGCRTYVALQTRDWNRAKALLACKYSRVEEDESGYIRVYDANAPEDIVTYLYENGILVNEIKTAKIGLEEYYIDLMNEKEAR